MGRSQRFRELEEAMEAVALAEVEGRDETAAVEWLQNTIGRMLLEARQRVIRRAA